MRGSRRIRARVEAQRRSLEHRRCSSRQYCSMRLFRALPIAVLAVAAPAVAQTPDGAAVFKQSCATCHTAAPADRAPADRALREMTPDAIRTALTTGAMRAQGQVLSDAQREAVATYLGGTSTVAGASANTCTTVPAVTD